MGSDGGVRLVRAEVAWGRPDCVVSVVAGPHIQNESVEVLCLIILFPVSCIQRRQDRHTGCTGCRFAQPHTGVMRWRRRYVRERMCVWLLGDESALSSCSKWAMVKS